MSTCPVCQKQISTMQCPHCGFDLSCHYEQYPTLAPLSGKIPAVSQRKQPPAPKGNFLRCSQCGHTGFSIALDTRRHICLHCGTSMNSLEFETLLRKQQKEGHPPAALSPNLKPVWQTPKPVPKLVALDTTSAFLLRSNGTITTVGHHSMLKSYARTWQNITSLSVNQVLMGLRKDGTVNIICTDKKMQMAVSKWHDIVDIAASDLFVMGLSKDGTVVTAGTLQTDFKAVSGWKDIAAIAVSSLHAVGLKKDGTVVAAGSKQAGRCDVGHWSEIQAIATGAAHTIGLVSDGTVVATGNNLVKQCDVTGWRNITAVAAGLAHTLGLREDGTVVATGNNVHGQCNVSHWRDIAAIYAGVHTSVGIKKDGIIVTAGKQFESGPQLCHLTR